MCRTPPTSRILLTLLLSVYGAGPAAADDSKPESLHGSWKLRTQEAEVKADLFTLTFSAAGKVEFLDDRTSVAGEYSTDVTRRPPVLEIRYRDEPAPWQGIYTFRDGELWICFADAGLPPPKQFAGGKGTALYKFRRAP